MALHELIASKRSQRAITALELATKCGCPPAQLVGYERGLLLLSEHTICELIKVLEIDSSEIVQACGEAAANDILSRCK